VTDHDRRAVQQSDDLLEVIGDLADGLAGDVSGCALASSTVCGSSGQPGVSAV
jgi:hypothetical protein